MTRRAFTFVIIWVQGRKALAQATKIWASSKPFGPVPKIFGPKKDQAKMSFTIYMHIEPSATEKVNF